MRSKLTGRLALLVLAAAMVAGCAEDPVLRESRELLAQGKTEEGLKQLERAAQQDPRKAEYRAYYFRQRAELVSQALGEGDAARAKSRFDAAEQAYRRALSYDPDSQRAMDGLVAVQADRRHLAALAEAEARFDRGETAAAASRLAPVLTENPGLRVARDLQRRIDERILQSRSQGQALKTAFSKPITLEFHDANIKSVFEVMSRSAGINFIFDRDVKPDIRVTLVLKDTAIEDVLRFLLATNKLEQKILNDNTVLIYPATPEKVRDYQDLMVKTFYLVNADVKQTLNLLKTILKVRDAFVEEKLNMLVIRDTAEVVRLAEKLIANHDLAEPEVVLDVEVLEVGTNRLSELGLRYPEQISGSLGTEGSFTLNDWKHRDSNFVTMKVTDPALILNLKKTDTDTRLLANPRIRVKNHEKAKVHIGERLPVITTVATAGVGSSESVSYLDIGLKLDVEPTIRLDDEVEMKVGLEVSNLLETVKSTEGTQTYRLGTRNTATALRLKNGETQILAGLIQDDQRNTSYKLPGLGDVPILGRLFSSRKDDNTKTEIVLLITPRVVRNLVRPQAVEAEFPSGTEADVGGSQLGLRLSPALTADGAGAAPATAAKP